MGEIPVHLADTSTERTDECRLCASRRAPDPSSLLPELRYAVPIVLVTTAGLVLGVVDQGPVGWLGGGVAVGIFACAAYMWHERRSLLRRAHQSHAREIETLAADADTRVKLVVKQFEWAVHDLAKLRRTYEEAEAAVRTLTDRGREREHQMEQLVRQISRLRERLVEIAMSASLNEAGKEMPQPSSFEAIYFTWGLHLDGARARLELQTVVNAESPTRLRVMDRDGQILAVSSTAVVSLDGTLEFQLEPPLDLINDLDEGREIDYAIEALVEHDWKPVRLRDTGRRTTSIVDVQGRLSRVRNERDASHLSESTHGPRSALN